MPNWYQKLIGSTSENVAEVDNQNRLYTRQGITAAMAAAGNKVAIVATTDNGLVLGTPEARDLETVEDFSLRVGVDNFIFVENFVGPGLNVNNWITTTNTLTAVQGNGFMSLNAGADLGAAGRYVALQSYKTHMLYGSASLYGQFRLRTQNAGQPNKVLEAGLAFATGNAPPSDGAVFRWATDGKLYGVLVNNGVETTTLLNFDGTPIPDNETHLYYLTITYRAAQFWIDDVLHGVIKVAPAYDSPVRGGSLPTLLRVYTPGTTSAPSKLECAEHQVFQGGPMMNRPIGIAMAMSGFMGAQGPSLGQVANWGNSAAVPSVTLSNTTPAYTTLGGLFQFAGMNGSDTDYALFAFQNPVASVTNTGRQFFCTGCYVSMTNTIANNATACVYQWGLGVGSTGASLATTDGPASKGPRRIVLGIQTFAASAPIGTQPPSITFDLPTAPLVVNPGEYLHVILKQVLGSSAGPSTFRGGCVIKGYWE